MSVADINDPNHQSLQDAVESYLKERDFLITTSTYHDRESKELKDRVSRISSATSLFYRTAADRWAVHRKLNLCFAFDAKTANDLKDRPGRDQCIEAGPLATHIMHAKVIRVLCLYCCRDIDGADRGFWMHDVPPIRVLMIPPQQSIQLEKHFRRLFKEVFEGVDVMNIRSTRGSNDPFAVIDETIVSMLPTWQSLIEEIMRKSTPPILSPIDGKPLFTKNGI